MGFTVFLHGTDLEHKVDEKVEVSWFNFNSNKPNDKIVLL